jgi:hypothetical protein
MAYSFVNCLTGSDNNDGLSWETAFSSLDRAWLDLPGDVTGIFIAPGVYNLLLPSETRTPQIPVSDTWQVLVMGVGGGPIVKSGGVSTAHSLYTSMTRYLFANATFHANTLKLLKGPDIDAKVILNFSNCGLADDAIVVGFDMETPAHYLQMLANQCRFEGALPTFPSASPRTSGVDCINFNSLKLRTTTDSRIVNGTPGMSFSPSGFMNGLFLYPYSVQYDAHGPSFRRPEELMAVGIAQGLITQDSITNATPSELWRAVNGVYYNRFSEWLRDPSGPTAEFTIINCVGADVLPASVRLSTTDATEGARILGPVMHYPTSITLTQIVLQGQEFALEGSRQVFDSTPNTSERTVEIRFSDTPFTQTAASPVWVTVERDVDVGPYTAKYLQYRITFSLGAVI